MKIFKNKMFYKWAKSEGLPDSALIKAVKDISQGLMNANLGGNLIKKRIAKDGRGKSGGFRTVIAFKNKYRAFYIYGFAKNQCNDISDREEKALKKLAHYLLQASEEELTDMIANNDLYEVNI